MAYGRLHETERGQKFALLGELINKSVDQIEYEKKQGLWLPTGLVKATLVAVPNSYRSAYRYESAPSLTGESHIGDVKDLVRGTLFRAWLTQCEAPENERIIQKLLRWYPDLSDIVDVGVAGIKTSEFYYYKLFNAFPSVLSPEGAPLSPKEIEMRIPKTHILPSFATIHQENFDNRIDTLTGLISPENIQAWPDRFSLAEHVKQQLAEHRRMPHPPEEPQIGCPALFDFGKGPAILRIQNGIWLPAAAEIYRHSSLYEKAA